MEPDYIDPYHPEIGVKPAVERVAWVFRDPSRFLHELCVCQAAGRVAQSPRADGTVTVTVDCDPTTAQALRDAAPRYGGILELAPGKGPS